MCPVCPNGGMAEGSVLARRLGGLPVIVRSLSLGVLWLVLPTSTAWADAATDRFQAYAREQLQKPYRRTPYPCSAFYSSGKDGYVLDMRPWAAAAGLRRGDRPVAYGGTPLTGVLDSDNEVWAR